MAGAPGVRPEPFEPTRSLRRIAAAALAGVVAISAWGQVPASLAQEPRPNVVVIETDDQTVESMRVMSNVNSLIGAQGATFKNSFVNYSLCCPSRATFLTGQYAHNHGVTSNRGTTGGFRGFQALHGDNNLAIWLRDAGYHTGLIGKYMNLYANEPPVPRGWSEWHAGAPDEQHVYDYTLNNNGNLVHYGQGHADFKQDVLSRKAVDFIYRRAPRTAPFFLWLNYTAPHYGAPNPSPNPPFDCGGAAQPAPRHAHAFDAEPLPKPPNFNEVDVSDKPESIRSLPPMGDGASIGVKYRCALESLLSVDEGVKKVVQALVANGELNNTLIIYTSDNGFFYGEHRIRAGKMRVYEESIRVPLLMRGPGIPRGETVSDLVINADLAPTIVDAANATPGLVMDGRSLIPVAQNPGIERGRHLLIEEPPPITGVEIWGPPFEAIRTGRYVYSELSTGERELYYLPNDPFELESLHDHPAYAGVESALADRLRELRDCFGASCRVP